MLFDFSDVLQPSQVPKSEEWHMLVGKGSELSAPFVELLSTTIIKSLISLKMITGNFIIIAMEMHIIIIHIIMIIF